MAMVFADRVNETTTTTGTGTLSLGGAADGFQGFVAGIGTTNECSYCITDDTDWEIGEGTVTDASPDTLSRDTILASSNSDAAVSWSSGTKKVFVVYPAGVVAVTSYTNSTNNRVLTSVDSSTVNGEANLTFDGSTLAITGAATVSTNLTVTGDLTISGDDLTMATNTSGAALIADGTNFNPVVISGDISINASGVAAIGSAVIVEADIADNAVTLAKMAGGTDGNIISYDASGDPVAVATGDDGQVLTSAGAGQPPAFETAGGGGATQEFFTPVTFVSGGATMIQTANFGPGAQANSDNDRGHVAFIVPADFLSIDELVFVVIPDVTNSASWWKTSVGYGSPGQAPNAHSSDSSVYYNVTEDVLYEVDLSGEFSAIVAGDQCGIQIYQNGAGGDVTFLGVRFKY